MRTRFKSSAQLCIIGSAGKTMKLQHEEVKREEKKPLFSIPQEEYGKYWFLGKLRTITSKEEYCRVKKANYKII